MMNFKRQLLLTLVGGLTGVDNVGKAVMMINDEGKRFCGKIEPKIKEKRLLRTYLGIQKKKIRSVSNF